MKNIGMVGNAQPCHFLFNSKSQMRLLVAQSIVSKQVQVYNGSKGRKEI